MFLPSINCRGRMNQQFFYFFYSLHVNFIFRESFFKTVSLLQINVASFKWHLSLFLKPCWMTTYCSVYIINLYRSTIKMNQLTQVLLLLTWTGFVKEVKTWKWDPQNVSSWRLVIIIIRSLSIKITAKLTGHLLFVWKSTD